MDGSNYSKKVLFYGCWPPPYGGIASHLYELLPALAKRNTEVYLAVNLEEGDMSYKFVNGIHIYHYNHKKVFSANIFTAIYYFIIFFNKKKDLNYRDYLIQICHFIFMKKIIIKNDINNIFTYDNPRILIAPFIRRKFKNLNIFSTIYADFLINKNKYENIKSYLIDCFKSSNLILSCSKFCVNSGKKYLNIDYPVKVIYNNVNPEIYSPLNDNIIIRKENGIPEDSIVLMTMCKMNHEMGIDFLLQIHEKILAIDPRLVIFFVGAKDTLSNKIKKLSILNKRIYYSFNIPSEKKPFYFSCADIFTAPTIGNHACMGIANIEAMMTGVPVISSDSGGHSETIEDKHDGYIIPLKNDSLDDNEYLKRLSSLVIDKKLRDKIGLRTRKRALELFSNEKIVDVHIEVINKLL
jgi:glycosyltransferase involved in cell wall biosynthesis